MNAPVLIMNGMLSAIGGVITYNVMPKFASIFINAQLFGIDMSKKTKNKIPEAMGVISGSVFLMIMFLFIPLPFSHHLAENNDLFPHDKFVEVIAALLSVCCMLFLGFADDVLDLRWRHKLLLPTMASLPLLMVYFVNFNSTTVIIPKPLRFLFGFDVNLGILYYVYMGMLAVFCTNAINIYAGVNGLEVGQSLIIAVSIVVFNFIEIQFGFGGWAHHFSLYLMIPYIAVIIPLFVYNWYPSRVFVGDTFCYFSGMLFAVVGILGHFSKSILLFFIPQIVNFVFSIPQLFHLVPCPRHRLPRYNAQTDKMSFSTVKFSKQKLHPLGRIAFEIFHALRLLKVTEDDSDEGLVECNNFTLINLMLRVRGPTDEKYLTSSLLVIQVLCSAFAFAVRYPLARLFYDV